MIRTALCVALIVVLGYSFAAKCETKVLLPFQGRLTSPFGKVIPDGKLTIQFQMYDALSGGQIVWKGEKLTNTVKNGQINAVLGEQTSLTEVDFSQPVYLEITPDADGDNIIGGNDHSLFPRQSIIPTVYSVKAGNTDKLGGYNWSVLFADGDIRNRISGAKLMNGSVTSAKIAKGAVDADRLENKAVSAEKIADKAITSNQIADNTITLKNLERSLSDFLGELIRSSMVPAGTVMAFAGEDIPTGWLPCDGRSLNSQDYPRLYAAIGISWGGGYTQDAQGNETKGKGDFNLPDLRGVFLRGVNGEQSGEFSESGDFSDPDKNSRTAPVLGGNSGNEVGSYQQSSIKDHAHLFVEDDDLKKEGDYDYVCPWKYGVKNKEGKTSVDEDRFFYRTRKHPKNPFSTSMKTVEVPEGFKYGWYPKDKERGYLTGGIFKTLPDPDSPGGKEMRPKNAYVNYIIKY